MNKSKTLENPFTVVIVYDSVFGNTKKIAEALQDGFTELNACCRLVHASEVDDTTFVGTDLLVFGSPTRAFRPTPSMMSLINSKTILLDSKSIAVFDTRLDVTTIKSKFFRSFLNKMGYADAFLRKKLLKRKAIVINETQGFFVTGSEGPLREGELERAFIWAHELLEKVLKH